MILDIFVLFVYNGLTEGQRAAGKEEVIMKKLSCAIFALIMSLCVFVYAEEAAMDADILAELEDTDIGFDFDDGGYEGEWIQIIPLGIEFCLPEGWATSSEDSEDSVYVAASRDGTATLCVYLEAENVTDLAAWGERNLDTYELDEANFYDALVSESDGAIQIRFIAGEDNLICFSFDRTGADALSREAALQIVGSVCELWDDDVMLDGGLDFEALFGEEGQ